MIAINSVGLLRGLSWASVFLAVIAIIAGLFAIRMVVMDRRRRAVGPILCTQRDASQPTEEVPAPVSLSQGDASQPTEEVPEPVPLSQGDASQPTEEVAEPVPQSQGERNADHDEEKQRLDDADRSEIERARRYAELSDQNLHDSDTASGPGHKKAELPRQQSGDSTQNDATLAPGLDKYGKG